MASARGGPASGGGGDMLPQILAIVAGAALVAGLVCITLKATVVKPGRIIAAAKSTAVHETLPGVILQVVMDGPLKSLKRLNLSPADLQPTAEAAFPPAWIETELEILVHDAAGALKSGAPVRLELGIDAIKDDMGGAIEALLRERINRVPDCVGVTERLCKPNGSRAGFLANVGRIVSGVVEKMPDNYPILAGPAADGIKSLQGVLGSLGWAAALLLLLALGAGAVAMNKKEGSLLHSAGIGLAGGALVGLFVVYSIKGAVLDGLGAAVTGYEASVAQNLTAFVSQGIGGGFTAAFVVLAVMLAGGAGAIFKARQDS